MVKLEYFFQMYQTHYFTCYNTFNPCFMITLTVQRSEQSTSRFYRWEVNSFLLFKKYNSPVIIQHLISYSTHVAAFSSIIPKSIDGGPGTWRICTPTSIYFSIKPTSTIHYITNSQQKNIDLHQIPTVNHLARHYPHKKKPSHNPALIGCRITPPMPDVVAPLKKTNARTS